MRAVASRVLRAQVTAFGQGDQGGGPGEVTGKIDAGLLVLVGVTADDIPDGAAWLAGKLANLRVFDDDQGRMNRSVLDTGGGVLVVSQFTLYGDARAGRRPSYVAAARPEVAEPLVAAVVDELARLGVPVATGRFRAHMEIDSVADGPVTILLDTATARR